VRRVPVHVVERQAERGRALAHLGVLARDELAMLFGVLPVGEEPAQRVDRPPARTGFAS
jgi:hypothetical protein